LPLSTLGFGRGFCGFHLNDTGTIHAVPNCFAPFIAPALHSFRMQRSESPNLAARSHHE